MRKLATVLTAVVFIVSVPASGNLVPDIGGDPIYTQANDDFSGEQTDWALTVYSYVFDNTSSSLPGSLTLDPGEMLFMYLLYSHDSARTVSVAYFSIRNPELVPINPVGYEPSTSIVPVGFESTPFQAPYLYGYSGPAQETFYAYPGTFLDPYTMNPYSLDPGEYSLVYYIAVAPGYTQVPAAAVGGGVGDNGLVPGPVPEPATVLLLGLGALALLRKRRV